MGGWFSNIHIRKGEAVTKESVTEAIRNLFEETGYTSVPGQDDAEGAVVIVANESSGWFSVCSELLSFEDPERYAEMAMPLSEKLAADVLGISCFDSDYLYLNLINAEKNTNAWVGIGSAAGYGVRRRTNLSAWQELVKDFPHFAECAKKKYVFAEEFLTQAESSLLLPAVYGALDFNDMQELEEDGNVWYLYFKVDVSRSRKAESVHPNLLWTSTGDRPCFPEKKYTFYARNYGAASKGLSVYFLGPYVKKEELTFSDTALWRWKGEEMEKTPFKLQKICMPNGKWAYYFHDPEYRILPRLDKEQIDRCLPLKQQLQIDRDQEIILTFVPHGDERKVLDVTVELIPDENPDGKVSWNVWRKWGSKKKYFQLMHMLTLSKVPGFEPFLYRRIDFD